MYRPIITSVLALLLTWLLPALAVAGIAPAYSPLIVQASGLPQRHEFDLTVALMRARAEHKHLYVYLGASDCPFCRLYESFLARNAAELVSHFSAQYIVVDLRSALSVSAKMLFIRVGDRSLPYADFQRAIGDERARTLVYPSVWLLDHDAKPLMQMPAGTGTFQTVPEQLEILRLVQ
jgi:thiol-disulfide isomerase/thioredoxin